MMSNIQFIELFDLYFQSVVTVLSYYSADKAEVEDWTQEVFVTVWEKRDKIDPKHPGVKGYILRIARNHALYKLRRKRSDFGREERDMDTLISPIHSVEELIHERELTHAYEDALKQVSPRTREAFLLSRHKGLTYKQIAVRMGISPKTVENQIGHVLKVLRSELHEYRT